MTLNKHTQICGRKMFETGIKDVFVVLISEDEEFLNNEKLKISEYQTDVIYEAELKGALNSLELSTDAVYKDLNFRICNLQRQQILMSQALLQQQIQTLRDESGQTVYSHASGGVVNIHKCKSTFVKPRIETEKCCEEMAVWSGRDF